MWWSITNGFIDGIDFVMALCKREKFWKKEKKNLQKDSIAHITTAISLALLKFYRTTEGKSTIVSKSFTQSKDHM